MYQVKEIFYTLQGEGARTGRPAVFCRFSGCNLWSGLEKDRNKAICSFCDTDFVGINGDGGGKFSSAIELAEAIDVKWSKNRKNKYVVCTGGEPALQMDSEIIEELHKKGFEIAIETNGTLELPEGIDWVTVSPKSDAELKTLTGDELKLVYPQIDVDPKNFYDLDFGNFYLQPLDNKFKSINTQSTIQYCLENPKWRISLQTHKYIGIP
ncbi:MAG: 7-carboxy-7-deazaguanine synthase [SAR86 cluster bacterium]|nr:7-carboxy-7-deazaguanine synthase [SAR86 cluster bacterium]|tara:strand:+ start:2520 stop:3149 length:630 start_codon:yes stop_codon:yes gene_type:complete